MNKFKPIVLVLLVLLAIYFLAIHYPPFPLSHESLGLYQHDIHRMIGVVFLVLAGLALWKWK